MSSFVCSATHFNSVCNYITGNNLNQSSYALRDLNKRDVESWIQDVYDLNCTTVCMQYNENRDTCPETLVKTEVIHLNEKDFFNVLCCIRYQIEMHQFEEGIREATTEEVKTFEILEDLLNEIARKLARKWCDDAKHKWSIE